MRTWSPANDTSPGVASGQGTGPKADTALFRTAISYLLAGEAGHAYLCLDRMAQESYAVAYNKALCCYLAAAYEACFRLLGEAERLLPHHVSCGSKPLPLELAQWEFKESSPFCPMPEDAPTDIARIQVLRLKAEAAGKLELTEEVKRIASGLNGEYTHIKNLMNKTPTNHDDI